MSIIKERVRYTGNNMNLKISLSSNVDFVGQQQEIDSLTQFKTAALVNPITDAETRRFKLNIDTPTQTLQFYFYNGSGGYFTTYTTAGFTVSEITSNSNKFLNSFFILDFYDTYDINTQNKIFTTYLTKKQNINVSSFPISNNNNQLYYWYIPTWYTNQSTGTTLTGYVKFSFFNAKTGKIISFYNADKESDITAKRIFFKSELNVVNKTWKIIEPSYPLVKAREIPTNQYTERMDSTVDKFDNLQQVYPTGNTFTYDTGKGRYETI
jgi:hypothetical protein